ncbi:bifunctional D-glycero-beta-D-manno-heptose-7-phosphate kinase/D-glycero-beta-D-manno-heptose 1-phosphate adenylyltransferase HldE [Pokkaliibacter sp. MBI-7]|uniref:bifunctional D-glycero-beta-D-manno-heptose-7-phosphate kinase/D-glycero-beta-D-manno-heptose 1-phosphate adenylyltransferase HldE n=1 Tax=Pokkaliibacter sp. MBI-7 TaxID=3040600 RepID=UPI002447805F|nr:bifunctional D-glycero-beta-D-manno-heptose-7-phosphate kinase/D-glycero-beta-D-manno-heptose 1-phosphate adenylyltransferase HldE [Pokkaliibacter sp. MBI-7]MDH2432236.1 bifunctional D-glycero-beta-D-manno-heptose-7-phosphate kinase/D-glycero-beta-D-manno-heptose 1-phosphate adenylyltransferase HldE [Pokkaliibacter sp. MBI-7]
MKLSLPDFLQARVLVVGDVMLDRYWHGGASRISPEAPVPVVGVKHQEDRPGGAANVALNIAALGGKTVLMGLTGGDEAEQALRERLQAAGVDSHFHAVEGHPTITKLRVIAHQQQLIRLDFEQRFREQDSAALLEQTKSALAGAGVLLISDYDKGALQHVPELIAAARQLSLPIVADPKGKDFAKYRGATLITPNMSEFEGVVGVVQTEQELVDKGLALLEELDLQALLITRSEKGMTLLRRGCAELHFPAQAREVYDVTGAGDTVISVLATALAAGTDLPQAVALANTAAGIVVGKLGTASVSAPELRRAIQRQQGGGRGVVSAEQLLIALEDARAHGEKVVFTNGCFDILHAGHVTYLEDARALGDRLVVAINDDDSVRRLKGPGRPVNSVDRRMAVLAGLVAVDWVVSFSEDTPEALLEKVRPEILVKGGDYSEDQVVGGEFVKAYGGVVKVLSHVENCSTTAIVNKIKQDR